MEVPMKLRVPLVLVALTVLGCVSAQVLRLGPPRTFPPVAANEVQVFMTEADVKSPFEKLALIKLKGDSDYTNETMMVEKAKAEAAKIGANGIILGQTDEPSAGAKVAGALFGISTQRRGDIVAIRFQTQATSDTTRSGSR
jgi:hypothetical protein